MDLFEQLTRSEREFRERLQLVGANDWSRPTPCSEWDVTALVNHVLGGPRRSIQLLEGKAADQVEATRGADYIGDDPLASFDAGARAVAAAYRRSRALERVVHHHAGDCRGEDLLKRRIVDNAIHAWDLARSIGADDRLDAGLVSALHDRLLAEGTGLVADHFAKPSVALGSNATQQDRLLDLLGRDPEWPHDLIGGQPRM
jgi:uncharacterized protein (TIGR03086 family)